MISKPKKILYIFTLGILIFLIFCTFLSIHIEKTNLPVVEVVKPVRMSLTVSGTTEIYNTVIPSSAIIPGAENRKYVHVIRQRQGLFGIEDYAKFIEVEIIASDGAYTAIDDLLISNSDQVILSSSKYVTPEETVKIK